MLRSLRARGAIENPPGFVGAAPELWSPTLRNKKLKLFHKDEIRKPIKIEVLFLA